MIMRRALVLASLCAMTLSAGSCDECAGTPSCTTTPEISYSGQFIDRVSGAPVQGVSISFVRSAGAQLLHDPSAMSDDDGFFVLRAPALQEGHVAGELRVVPPAPDVPYAIPNVTLRTNSIRGDGGNLGRLVVKPFLFLIGHVRDRFTHAPLPSVVVTFRRVAGGRVAEDTREFVTDAGGQFGWEPAVIDPAPIDATFELVVEGHPRPYVIRRQVGLNYRDFETSFVILPVGWGLAYSAGTLRRGSNEVIPGVAVQYRRISGIQTEPAEGPLPVDGNGSFPIAVTPLSEGSLTAELRVVPPPPFPPETSVVQMETSDDDVVRSLGYFRYGAQVVFSATLRDDAGLAIPEGTVVMVERESGPALALKPAAPDSGLRVVDASGRLAYQAPTADSGAMQIKLIVRLPAPFAWDTIRPINVPSAYSDSTYDVGIIAVRRRNR